MSTIAALQHKIAERTRISHLLNVLDSGRARIYLVTSIAVLGLLYLWLVNSSAAAGFYLSDLERQVVALEEEFQQLELEKTALHSLEYVEQRGESMQMVTSTSVEYVQGDTAVALANE